MAKLFFSYARKDASFVRQLYDKMTDGGHEVWVDWKDIPPSVDWFDEVQRAITEADVFVFVVSVSSTESAICHKEVAFADEQNKRLIPLIRERVPEPQVPEQIRGLNWIFFDEDESFAEAFGKLNVAIDTDIDRIHAHTRLLARAREWQQRNREPSLLLRGIDLRSAEIWITEAEHRAPVPTAVHVEFIVNSRKAATRRLSLALGVVAGALVLVAALAVIALAQRADKEHQRLVAVARQLGAQAELTQRQEPRMLTRGALLGAESLRRWPTAEADIAVRHALMYMPRFVRSYPLLGNFVTDVFFSADGQRLVVETKQGGGISIWDSHSDEKIAEQTFPGGFGRSATATQANVVVAAGQENAVEVRDTRNGELIAELDLGQKVSAVAVSPSGKLIAAAGNCGSTSLCLSLVAVWRTEDRKLLQAFFATRIYAMAFDPGEKLLAVAEGCPLLSECDASFKVSDVKSGNAYISSTLSGGATAIAISTDGRYMAVVGRCPILEKCAANILVWDLTARREVARLVHEHIVLSVAFSPSGDRLATGATDGYAVIWDVPQGTPLARLAHRGSVSKVTFSADGCCLVTASEEGAARIWSVDDGHEIVRTTQLGSTEHVAISPDGRYLAAGGRNGVVHLWDTSALFAKPVAKHSWGIEAAAYSADGRYLATAGSDRWLSLYDLLEQEELTRLSFDENLFSLAISKNGSHLATANGGNTITVFESTGRSLIEVEKIELGCQPYDVAFDSGGRRLAYVAHCSPNHEDLPNLAILNWGTGHRVLSMRMDGVSGLMGRVAFSPDGQSLLITNDVGQGASLLSLKGDVLETFAADSVSNFAFSPQGRYVATAGSDESARIWDVVSGSELHRFHHDGRGRDVSFSPDGKRLLSGSEDGTARIWDIESESEVIRIEHGSAVNVVSYSPTRNLVLTAGEDGMAREWPYRPEDLIREVCDRVPRNLTRNEWSRFVGEEKYEPLCRDRPVPAE